MIIIQVLIDTIMCYCLLAYRTGNSYAFFRVEGVPFDHLPTDDTPLAKRLKLRSYATVLVRGGSGGGGKVRHYL